jgi:hypothetical protein
MGNVKATYYLAITLHYHQHGQSQSVFFQCRRITRRDLRHIEAYGTDVRRPGITRADPGTLPSRDGIDTSR